MVVLFVGGSSGGGTDQLGTLRALSRSLGIEQRVYFLPPQSGLDLVNVYRAADVVAVPSLSESFGLVSLEAQACGTPVAAADVGGLRTAVAHDVSGLLVPSHNPEVWAQTLAELLGSPSRLGDLGRNAVGHARQFSWRRTTDALLAAYGEAMDSSRFASLAHQPGVAV
jgi:D-inositol-3-phosphate glycosyltransferase